MLHHLPPTATPIALADLRGSLVPSSQARARFEAALSQYLGRRVCGVVASGRTALSVLLRCLVEATDQPARREVLLPAYTCPALVKVISDGGLQPCLVDISPQTLAFDLDQLTILLGERTLAVICVHPFGLPQDIGPVLHPARSVGAVVIEDAAQSLGARFKGRFVGTRGDFGLFSLGPGKPLSTGGGGFVCARADDALSRLATQALQALPAPSQLANGVALARLVVLKLLFQPQGWWLAARVGLQRVGNHEASWGYQRRSLTAVQAALGLRLLARLDGVNQQRRQNARRLAAYLQPLDFIHLPPVAAAAAEPIYLRLPLLAANPARREQLFQALQRAGVGVGRMYGRPLSEIFPALAVRRYPGAGQVARRLLTLPTHHYLTGADIERIASIFTALT